MPERASKRSNSRWIPATVGLALLSALGTASSAEAAGRIHEHFRNFYGQDFYAFQHPSETPSRGIHRQYDAGYYGPAMIYGRQYGDEYGTIRDRAFVPARFNGVNGPGGENVAR